MTVPRDGYAAVDHDNLEEFADPANYDIEESASAQAPAQFYGELAEASGGAVLEIACGTGLVTLPVAARGLDTTGTDICRPMLEHARGKAARQGLSVDWVEADARSLSLGRRFDVVYLTGNAFQAFLTDADQDALLSAVSRHLAPGGQFAFETRNPSGHDLSDRPGEAHWHRYVDMDGNQVSVSGSQRYDAAACVMHWTTYRRWSVDGEAHCRVSRIACRFTAADELTGRLDRHGFAIEACYGDFDRSPLAASSPSIVLVCCYRPRESSTRKP